MSRSRALKVIQLLSREVKLELIPSVLMCPLEVLNGLHDSVFHHRVGVVTNEGRYESGEVLGEIIGEQENHAGRHLDRCQVNRVRLLAR
jgi:hypothetical protein